MLQVTYDDMNVLYKQLYQLQTEVIDLNKAVLLREAEATRLRAELAAFASTRMNGDGLVETLEALES